MSNISFKNICKMVNVATKEKSVADFFVADLTYAICEYDNKIRENKVSQSYKPSSLHCIRNMYYQVTGQEVDEESNTTSELIGICESGTDRHNRIQDYILHMKDVGIDCEYVDVAEYVKNNKLENLEIIEQCGHETKLYSKKYNMRFLCDGIIKYRGNYYILEIKTETSFKWNKRTDVDDSHKEQANAYSLLLNLDGVIFLYENRDNCAKKSYLYISNDLKRNELSDKIFSCNVFVEHDKIPPRPADCSISTSKCCKYCNYRLTCIGDGD